MSALLEVDDIHEVIGRREVYRRLSRIGDARPRRRRTRLVRRRQGGLGVRLAMQPGQQVGWSQLAGALVVVVELGGREELLSGA